MNQFELQEILRCNTWYGDVCLINKACQTHCYSRKTAGSRSVRRENPQRACPCRLQRPAPQSSAAYSSVPACSDLASSTHTRTERHADRHTHLITLEHQINNHQRLSLYISDIQHKSTDLSWTGTGQHCTPCSCIHRSCTLLHREPCTHCPLGSTHQRPFQTVQLLDQRTRGCKNFLLVKTWPEKKKQCILMYCCKRIQEEKKL